jgi:hypothetical protein
MPMHLFGVFGPEEIAEMSEVLDAAFEKLQGTGEPDLVRERIATRIIAAARLGQCDPARLLEAALRRTAFPASSDRSPGASAIASARITISPRDPHTELAGDAE